MCNCQCAKSAILLAFSAARLVVHAEQGFMLSRGPCWKVLLPEFSSFLCTQHWFCIFHGDMRLLQLWILGATCIVATFTTVDLPSNTAGTTALFGRQTQDGSSFVVGWPERAVAPGVMLDKHLVARVERCMWHVRSLDTCVAYNSFMPACLPAWWSCQNN